MPTELTLDRMKQFVRDHFEDFVNKKDAAVDPQEHDAGFP